MSDGKSPTTVASGGVEFCMQVELERKAEECAILLVKMVLSIREFSSGG